MLQRDGFARTRAKLMWMGMVTDQRFIAFKHIVDNRGKSPAPGIRRASGCPVNGYADREMGELLASLADELHKPCTIMSRKMQRLEVRQTRLLLCGIIRI